MLCENLPEFPFQIGAIKSLGSSVINHAFLESFHSRLVRLKDGIVCEEKFATLKGFHSRLVRLKVKTMAHVYMLRLLVSIPDWCD